MQGAALPRTVWAVVALFVVMAGSWGLGQWHVQRVGSLSDQEAKQQRQEAFMAIQDAIDEAYAAMNMRAHTLARHPAVVSGLRQLAEGQEAIGQVARGQDGGRRQLVAWAASIERPAREFVEVYDPTPALQAWSGAAFPMDAAVRSDRFMLQDLESLATDARMARSSRTARAGNVRVNLCYTPPKTSLSRQKQYVSRREPHARYFGTLNGDTRAMQTI
jgi:hypothetical protein